MKTIPGAFLILTFVATMNLHAETVPDAQLAAGRKLFLRHCSECHGQEGLGTERGPSIANVVTGTDRASLEAFIKNGNLRRGMPSWSRLPDKRLDQIVAYLQTLNLREE